MKILSPLKTGQLVVRFYTPRRRALVIVLLLVVLLLIPYLTYEWGRTVSGYSIVAVTQERLEHMARVRKLEEQVAQLQSGVASADLARNVDHQSYVSVGKTVAELQDEVRRQRDELAFYQAIISPKENAMGPRVQRVEVMPTTVTKRYRLKLLLIQSLPQKAVVGGSLQVTLAGTRAGSPVAIPLAELRDNASDTKEISFSFRYFQEIEQEVALPPNFIPATINLELHSNRQAVTKQSFPWRVQGFSGGG